MSSHILYCAALAFSLAVLPGCGNPKTKTDAEKTAEAKSPASAEKPDEKTQTAPEEKTDPEQSSSSEKTQANPDANGSQENTNADDPSTKVPTVEANPDVKKEE